MPNTPNTMHVGRCGGCGDPAHLTAILDSGEQVVIGVLTGSSGALSSPSVRHGQIVSVRCRECEWQGSDPTWIDVQLIFPKKS